MCSIIGYCGGVTDRDAFEKGFARTKSRGPDDSKIVDTGRGLLGFHRLSIMGLTPSGMQPFELNGSYVVCNGELYGFEKERERLRQKGYTFRSDSDCEIILPMYFEYGVGMFSMLDAEFACVIFDGRIHEFIAARDPIGIRPLYYGYDAAGTIMFASEPKNLVGLTEKIMPFPPGHYYKSGRFICYRNIARADTLCSDDLETACGKIQFRNAKNICRFRPLSPRMMGRETGAENAHTVPFKVWCLGLLPFIDNFVRQMQLFTKMRNPFPR